MGFVNGILMLDGAYLVLYAGASWAAGLCSATFGIRGRPARPAALLR